MLIRISRLLVLAALAGSGGVQFLGAAQPGTLEGEIDKLAGKIKDFLTDKRLNPVVDVRPFQGLEGGTGLQLQLIHALEKIGIQNLPEADVKCEGNCVRTQGQDDQISINTRVLSSRNGGKDLGRPIHTTIKEFDAVVKLAGVTGAFDVSKPEQRLQDLKQARANPSVQLGPAAASPPREASATVKSKLGVELRLLNSATRKFDLPVVLGSELGMAVADLKLEDVYAICVHNRETRPVGITVSIDGVNLFALSKIDQYKQAGMLIAPPGETCIEGWHITNTEVAEFQVKTLPKAVISEQSGARPERIGTITVEFRDIALAPDGTLPGKQPEKRNFGTGKGLPRKADYKEVLVKAIGELREAVSIRYIRDLPPAEAPVAAPQRQIPAAGR